MGWFQLYAVPRTHPSGHGNAEAGPSTLVTPSVPYIDLTVPEPSGGISETTADAKTDAPVTEEDGVSVSNFYCSHIPRVTERSFSVSRPRRPESPAAKENHAKSA